MPALLLPLVLHYSDIRFARAEQVDTDVITVLSSDNDGWLHMRINLANLNTSCGGSNFDRIIFEDVSGMGFFLQLDEMKLLYGSAVPNFAASAFTFQSGNLLPVFGDDMTVVSCPLHALVKLNQQHIAFVALKLHSAQGGPAIIPGCMLGQSNCIYC